LGLGVDGLARIAADVGSDCAFFLRGGVQRGRGRGEVLEPIAPPPRPLDLVLLFPGVSVPTPQVYRALGPFLERPERREPSELPRALAGGAAARVAAGLWNRLEGPCFELFPAVAEAKRDLERRGLLGCLLSGSGATVLGLARNRAEAETVARAL